MMDGLVREVTDSAPVKAGILGRKCGAHGVETIPELPVRSWPG